MIQQYHLRTNVYIELKWPIYNDVQDDIRNIWLIERCAIYMITPLLYTTIPNAITVADGCAK